MDKKIRNLCAEATASFWELIATLKVFKEYKLWEDLGFDSFAQYLAQPEIALRERSVADHIRVYTSICSRECGAQRIKEIPKSKARLIAAKITDENAEELFNKALTLSWSDLRKEIGDGIEEIREEESHPFLKPPISWCSEHKKWWISAKDLGNMCAH